MASVPDWRVLYFDAPTRGEQVRLLFVATGTPFEDVRFKFPGGIKAFKQVWSYTTSNSPVYFEWTVCVCRMRGDFSSVLSLVLSY
jgi:hypothetical protein